MENILLENEIVEERMDIKEPKERKRFSTKKEPKKTFTNFQRNQYRALFSSMALSDRKSMILVRINTTLLSLLIAFHGYIAQNVPFGNWVVIVAVLGTGVSLIAGLLSSKPGGIRKTLKQQILVHHPNLKSNVLLHFDTPTLEEYEEAMDEVVRSQSLQIGNQTRTTYLINNMLLRQYKWLSFSYNAFITTFIVVISIFLVGSLVA
ncbi:Pycsar system effector family protein [Labilibacter marinus]|uniref:Pycsar system effector family protein n=1 Tax=Labilibacter marinus TaxID=1477105 RepID=UPI00094F4F15|nr:Pycsar system effector family protein [Labilibacter marinus]